MRAGKSLVVVATVVIASLLLAASASAGIRLTVTTTADPLIGSLPDSQCSLREAIGASNTSTTVGTADCPSTGSPSETQIGFDPSLGASPVINLNLANPNLSVLNNDVTITGPATVSGATDSGWRVITSSTVNLTLTSLTISNGSENVEGLGGGILQNGGRLFLNSSTVSGNKTTRTLTTSASAQGGGIYSTGPVTLTDSIVTNNQAVAICTICTGGSIALGGGVEASNTDLTMDNSVVSGNKAIASGDSNAGVEADGGGVRTDGDVLIEHSTVNGNLDSATNTGGGTVTAQGAGMLFHGATSTIDVELSTIANNLMKVTGNLGTSQLGGGIENFDSSDANYFSDTIVGNGLDPASSTAGVQGLNFQSAGVGVGSRTFNNTIIANPVGSVGSNCFGDTPYSDDSAPNLEFPGSISDPCFDATHMNVMHADPLLGALGSNGGATPTLVPAATSPVIDQGRASDQNDLTEDQRGLTRPVVFSGLSHPFDGSDIGAVEVQLACAGQTTPSASCAGPAPPPPPPSGATGRRAAALKKCKKLKGKTKAKKRKKCIKRAKKLPV
jgi:CSLREA domain-containing protein